MKISVITINFNNKNGLETTIKSVTSQTIFENIEYICIDGDSTDGSKDLINQYESCFSYVCSEKDSGRYNAMNKGILHSTSDYVLFLNSGDYFNANNVLELAINELDADIVYGDLMLIKNDGSLQLKKYESKLSKRYFNYESLPHPSSFIKRELFKDNLYFEDFDIISDWFFFYNEIIFKNRTYKHINVPISCFGLDGISSTNFEKLEKEKVKAYQLLAKNLQKKTFVALTTWEKRYGTVIETINTVLNQTIVPNKIFLNLSKDELEKIPMPDNLANLVAENSLIEINWVKENTKTMKKVFPILDKLNDDDIIINIDDDVLLDNDFIESRLCDFLKNGMEHSISSQPNFRWLGTYFSGCGSLMTKKCLKGYNIFINDEIIATYEDDWVYSFLHMLNGYDFVKCSKYSVPDLKFHSQEYSSKNANLYDTNNTSRIMQKRVYELTGETIRQIKTKKLHVKWEK